MSFRRIPEQTESERTHQHFDVLRGASAVIVFLVHIDHVLFARLLGIDSWLVIACGMAGRIAVLVFFLLSGYLITQSIRLNIARNGCFNAGEYWAARVARIYPPLIGAILVCAIVWGIILAFDLPGRISYGLPSDLFRVRDAYGFSWEEVPLALLMLGGLLNVDGPLYTLYVEFSLYLAAMAVAAWFGTPRFRIGWIAVGVAGLLLALRVPVFVPVWLVGAVVNLWPLPCILRRGLTLALGGAIAVMAAARPSWLTGVTTAPGQASQLLVSMLLCCVLVLRAPRWRYPRWLIACGGFSYSLYVIHWPILLLVLSLTQSWTGDSIGRSVAVALFATPPLLAFTIGFARVFERPTFYRRLANRLLTQPAKLARAPSA